MSDWKELIKEHPAIAGVTIVLSLALMIPIVAIEPGIIALLGTFAFLTWLVARMTGSSEDDAANMEETPVDELERQYIRGEITESEFEHRLSVLLEADEQVDRTQGTDRLNRTRTNRQTERAHEQ